MAGNLPHQEAQTAALFEARDLDLRRGGRRLFSALGFALSPGDALLLEGPNGCGKSSLLRALAGLTPLTHGALLWEGHLITKDMARHRGRLQLVGHLDGVKPLVSARANLALWCDLAQNNSSPVEADSLPKIDQALAHFGLTSLAQSRGRRLSAGQKRRLALARLLARPAPLWLLDEPASALDASGITALEAAIGAHRAQGGLVIAASHGGLALPGAQCLDLRGFLPQGEEAYLW